MDLIIGLLMDLEEVEQGVEVEEEEDFGRWSLGSLGWLG